MELSCQVGIAGGGPAGVLLGYLLARAGISVCIFEKHADFFRDFRGDTVHPSTLEIIQQCGLLDRFNKLPQHRVQHIGARIGDRLQPIIDLRGLHPFDYVALVPQWDFLNLLANEGRKFAEFRLFMQHEVTELISENGRVVGLKARSPNEQVQLRAQVIVGCDGRHSDVRRAAGLEAQDLGAPMDALWFKLPREASDMDDTFAVIGAGHILVLLNRNDYWQAAYVVPKGQDAELRQAPIESFRAAIREIAPFLPDRTSSIKDWEDVKTLRVTVDRLQRWYLPGLLLIGDAAHAMSPIGGVGINLAVQDAVAASNVLASAFRQNQQIDAQVLRRVQERRLPPTRIIQWLQLQAQNRIISKTLMLAGKPPQFPALLRWLLQYRFVRNIPARIIGYGFGRQRVSAEIINGPQSRRA